MGNCIGVLYIVATPIGNLGDITFRAVEILKNADLIAAEDTRTTRILLDKYKISTPLESYHKFSEIKKCEKLTEKILSGSNIALVSDAGTPLICDPGNILISSCLKAGIKIVPIGGISAITTFISGISRNGDDFKFIGFMPKIKTEIEDIIKQNKKENLIFYESPLRIIKTLQIIENISPNALISIGRELTKKFEEIKTLKSAEMINHYLINPLKGEIVCMVHKNIAADLNDEIFDKISALKNAGFSLKETALILEITDNIQKNKVKSLYLNEFTGKF
ncbi:MAG: 16S rRNA (cytidine(1402)-2'-O)-methyltransferase [Candidatus Gastranaerophilales bacterium]|nr:16S rRNA (cytidine(1402)-2'-O)-methyltransferase [Candidatus Gastranaerophilales bacterium]